MMMMKTLILVGLAMRGLVMPVDGSKALLARPPIGKHGGFLVKDSPGIEKKKASESQSSPTTSSVSVGIRSARAREKAATLRNKDEAGTSAATRLRGGSWGPGYAPFVPQVVHAADKPKERASYERVENCAEREHPGGANGNGAQYATAKQRVVDEDTDSTDSYEDEDEDGGGGGGGGRAGAPPSFPRTLPAGNGKAVFNKKFAWVP